MITQARNLDCQTEAQESAPTTPITPLIVIAVVVGVVISLIAWGAVYLIFGSMSEFMGIKRIWFDVPGFAAWFVFMVLFLGSVDDRRNKMEEDDECDVSLWEFGKTHRFVVVTGIVMIADVIAGFFWNFAVTSIALYILWLIYVCLIRAWSAITSTAGDALESVMERK